MIDHFDAIAAKTDENVTRLADLLGLAQDQAILVYGDICKTVSRAAGQQVDGVLTFSANRMSTLLDGAISLFQATYIRGWSTEAALAQVDLWLSLHADVASL